MAVGPNAPYTGLDAAHIFQRVFDETLDKLRVDTSATIVGGAMEIVITHTDDSVKIGDGTDFLAINGDGSANVVIVGGSLSLGSADKTTFTYGTTTQLTIGGVYQDTTPTITSGQQGALRLTSYRGLHSNLRDSSGNELLGQKAMAASVPVVVASNQGNLSVLNSDNLVPYAFDYIGATYPTSASEAYTYKTGGAGGSTVATVTVVFTDSTKSVLTSVTRT